MIIGTAGHIDHGKSALVRALTGVEGDRLKEEKARGITIDLGYAYQHLSDGTQLGFVDVPGHEKFIHNMLAGATGIDYVMLAVAADDGPMPQTREHLAILELLGLSRGVVALTKIDLVDAGRRLQVEAEIAALLAPTALAGLPVCAVSAVTGEGIDLLSQHLHAAAVQQAAPSGHAGHFRMAVDRSFTIKGIGTVVTGSVLSGRVNVGDRLITSPAGIAVRVRSLHAQNKEATEGRAGQRCALNLVASQLEKTDIARGEWLVDAAVHAPTTRLDVRLRLLPAEAQGLRHWTPVHVHLGTANVTGRVALLESDKLAAGQTGLVQLVLDRPIGALHGDRFILRDQSAQRTIGGGHIIDPVAPERGRRTLPRLAMLQALDHEDVAEALATVLDSTSGGIDLDWFLQIRNITAADQPALLARVPMEVLPAGARGHALALHHYQTAQVLVLSFLQSYHLRMPESAGATLDEIRSGLLQSMRLERSLLTQLLLRLLAAPHAGSSEAAPVKRVGGRYQLPGHEVSLSAAEQVLWERAQPVLAEAGIESVRVTFLAQQLGAPDDLMRALLGKQVRCGKLYQVRRDLYFLPQVISTLALATQRITEGATRQVLTVGPFRESTGISRNLAIPMLEFFDRSGFTIRFGHGRRLRRDSAAVFGEMPGDGS